MRENRKFFKSKRVYYVKSNLLFCILVALVQLGIVFSYANLIDNYADFHAGFRYDKLKNVTGSFIPNDYRMQRDVLIAKNLNIWEIGFAGQAEIKANWFAKGYYSHGWVASGHFKDAPIHGITSGYTNDVLVGLGYQTSLAPRWALSPLFGWGFNQQNIHLVNGRPRRFNYLWFKSIWNGPWLGFDLMYQFIDTVSLTVGYEFHLTDWRGAFHLKKEVDFSFSDHRRMSTAYGQVVYIDARWKFKPHWNLEAEFKYQNWSTRGTGSLNSSTNVPTYCPDITVVSMVKHMYWYSYGFSLNIGYLF